MGSVGFFMYVHLVYSTEFLTPVSGRKSTRKRFRQATDLMVLIDHESIANCTSPSFAFLSCPFHMGILLSLGERLIGAFWDTYGWGKPKSKSCANANFVYL